MHYKQFFKLFSIFFTLLIILSPGLSWADEEVKKPSKEWLEQFKQDAISEGISENLLNEVLPSITINEKVVKLDQKQPYKTLTFKEYIDRVVPDSRVKKARQKYQENKQLLDKIGKKYGVQPRFIVALWAVESNFGSNMGGFKIIDALATLAIDGRREAFFRKELINALKIIDQGHISVDKMLGSWAGAMGQSQFMPSSFLELAVDGNDDGKIDIWGTKEDVFSSIANYLSKRGWDDNTTWGRKILLPSSFNRKLATKSVEKTLKEWQNLGVRKFNGGNLPKREDLIASVISPEDEGDEFFLTYSNYKTILKWNRSLYFATAVGILSDKIGY